MLLSVLILVMACLVAEQRAAPTTTPAKKTKKKVAVLIVGESRGFETDGSMPFKSISKYVLGPLLAEDPERDMDVFLCFKGVSNDIARDTLITQSKSAFERQGLGPRVDLAIQVAPLFTTFPPKTYQQGKAALHRTQRCYDLATKNGTRTSDYNWMVRLRPDSRFFSPLPTTASLDPKRVHIRARAANHVNLTSDQTSAAPCIKYGCTCHPCFLYDDQIAMVPVGPLSDTYFRLYDAYLQYAAALDPHNCVTMNHMAEADFTRLLLQTLSFADFQLLSVSAIVHQINPSRGMISWVRGKVAGGAANQYTC